MLALSTVVAGLAFALPAPQSHAESTPAAETVPIDGPEFGEEPLWRSDARFGELLAALQGLEAHGLDPNDYYLRELSKLWDEPQLREPLATRAWLRAAEHLAYGRLHLSERDADWRAGERFIDLQEHLQHAIATESVAHSLDELAPQNREYRALAAELARLQTRPETGTVPVPEGPLLRKGDSGLRVQFLRVRLAQLGYLPPDLPQDSFDDEVTAAVEAFQWDAGLEPDGIVGPQTRDLLNLTARAKVKRLRINLERLRWLPGDLGERHVRVNIAGFEVGAYENGVRVQTHRAIVGRLERQTPVFSNHIRYIVINPWWETPGSIARKDELPLFRRDPRRRPPPGLSGAGPCHRRSVGPFDHRLAPGARPVLPLPPAAGAGTAERARAGQDHVPEPAQRLSARHAETATVRALAAHLLLRLHPGAGCDGLGALAAGRSGALGRRADSGRCGERLRACGPA